MGFEIRCNCGWSNRVGEFYLPDRVICPDCNLKLNAPSRECVPYGYPPYHEWPKSRQSSGCVRLPVRRQYGCGDLIDPYAGSAFWLGLGGLLLTATICGMFPGLIIALFAVRSVVLSCKYCRDFGLRQRATARAGLVMALAAPALAAGALFVLAQPESSSCHGPLELSHPELASPTSDCDGQCELKEEVRDRSEPKPQQVAPKNEFERYQQEYSRRVQESRAEAR